MKKCFLGVHYCENCDHLFYLYLSKEFNYKVKRLSFVFLGIPISSQKTVARCPICGCNLKVDDKIKDLYKKSLKLNFDKTSFVDIFLNEIEKIIYKFNYVNKGKIYEENFNETVKYTINKYQYIQGFDNEYYEKLIQLCAYNIIIKLNKNSLLFSKE